MRCDFGMSGQMKVVVLRGDGVWISGSWKVPRLMVRPAVGGNDAFTTGYCDGHAIGADACLNAICVRVGAQLCEGLEDEARERERDEEE